MENDLISRSAVFTVGNIRKVTEYDEAGYDMTYDAVPVEVIEALPAIDAVPVVRCKDCIYRDRAMRCIALYYGFNPHDEWFCANGTRMDDEKSEEDTNEHQTV